MRKMMMTVAAGALAATPAMAVDLEDLAKVVLGGGAVLKKAEQKCTGQSLSKKDQLAITLAVAATEQALPISQFQSLDQTAKAEADQAADAKAFCPETKKKKSGLISKIKKAGKAIIVARGLG